MAGRLFYDKDFVQLGNSVCLLPEITYRI